MSRFLAFLFFVLAGCSAQPTHVAALVESTKVTGTVEKICPECSEALLANGGFVLWDVLTVRVTGPEAFSGTVISVEVLVEGDGKEQRKTYPSSSRITFDAAKAAIVVRRVMLNRSDIHGS